MKFKTLLTTGSVATAVAASMVLLPRLHKRRIPATLTAPMPVTMPLMPMTGQQLAPLQLLAGKTLEPISRAASLWAPAQQQRVLTR
jgi:hypothetical protein